MAQIIIQMGDNTTGSFFQDIALTKPFDVLMVVDDKWTWGSHELQSDFFRIINLPGIDPNDLQFLTTPEKPLDSNQDLRFFRPRKYNLNFDNRPLLSIIWKAYLTRSRLAQPILTIDTSRFGLSDILALANTKTLVDQTVNIGPQTNNIGLK